MDNDYRRHDSPRSGHGGPGGGRDAYGAPPRRGVPLSDLDPVLTEVSRKVIGAAIEVHRNLGPGFPEDAYARLLLAEELYHRGPLVGRDLDEAVRAMSDAVDLDSTLALGIDHLVAAPIRMGRRSEVEQALELRRRVALKPSPGDPDVGALLRLAYNERFLPPWWNRLRRRILAWAADSAQLDGLRKVARTGVPWFDIPETQLALCGLLLETADPAPALRAAAHEGRGLALLALRTEAPVVPIFIRRESDGGHHIIIEPPIPPSTTGDREKDVTAFTAAFTWCVEETVRRWPEQWFWVHRRWKTRPGQEA